MLSSIKSIHEKCGSDLVGLRYLEAFFHFLFALTEAALAVKSLKNGLSRACLFETYEAYRLSLSLSLVI